MNKVVYDVYTELHHQCWDLVFRKNKFDVEFIDEQTYPGTYQEFITNALWEEENT